MLAQWLVFAGAAILFLMGTAHLIFTFRGKLLTPRDPEVTSRLQQSFLVISPDMTVWNAWIGFNASHSFGAMLFGAVYGYLAVAQASVLFGSAYLAAIGALLLAGLLVVARRYWFFKVLRGISIATVCYVAGFVVAWI